MAAESIKILNFSGSGEALGHFGKPSGARGRKKADFLVQEASQDGPGSSKERPREAKRAAKEAPGRPKERQRGSRRRFRKHYGKRGALGVQRSQDPFGEGV